MIADVSIFQADLLRLVEMTAAGWSLAMTIAILAAFFGRVGWGIGWRDIEKRKKTHIVLVSVSFIILSIYAACEVYGRLGQRLTWRGPTLTVAFIIAGVGQFSMLSAQMSDRRHTTGRTAPAFVPVDPVIGLIERVVFTMDRIEERLSTNGDAMTRMEDADKVVASDLAKSISRADSEQSGEPGAAADAGLKSDPKETV